MIYTSAIYATADESMVTGTDADGNSETVPANFILFRQPDDGPVGFVNNGGVIADYVEPEPAPYFPSTPVVVAAAYNVSVSPGEITGVGAGANIAAAFALDVGSYMLFFNEPQPDTSYFPRAYDAGVTIQTVEKGEDYIILSGTDRDGNPADPAFFSVELVRVI